MNSFYPDQGFYYNRVTHSIYERRRNKWYLLTSYESKFRSLGGYISYTLEYIGE